MDSSTLRARLEQDGWRSLLEQLRVREGIASELEQLEQLAEADPDVDIRYKARKVLSKLPRPEPPAPVPAPAGPPPLGQLTAHLAGQAPADRIQTLARFVAAHRQAAVEELTGLLATEQEPTVLSAGVKLVGEVGHADLLPHLKPLLSHSNARVVANTVEAMGRLDPSTAPTLVMPMLVATDHRVRANVLMVLYKTSREEVLEYLGRMAASVQEPYRAAAVWCFSQIKDPGGADTLGNLIANELWEELAESGARVLAETGTPEAIPELAKLARSHPARNHLLRRAITGIATRHQLAQPELEKLIAQGEQATLANRLMGFSGKLKQRLRNSLRMRRPVLPGETDRAPFRQRWLRWGLGVVTLLVGAGVVHLALRPQVAPKTVRQVRKAPVKRATPASAAPAKPSGKAKVAQFVGRVLSCVGSTLVVRNEYTTYAIQFRSKKLLQKVKKGQKVRVRARYRGWNRMQGYVNMEGQLAKVVK